VSKKIGMESYRAKMGVEDTNKKGVNQMEYKTLIVDGPYLAHRSSSAPFKLTTSTGLNSTMIHTFLVTLNSLYKRFHPSQTIIAWESHGTQSWRKAIQPTYKQKRTTLSNEYITELHDLQIILHLLKITQYYSSGNEADDVIATLVQDQKNLPSIIFTVDKDLMQLINRDVLIWDGTEFVDFEGVRGKFGIIPSLIPDLLSLWGDTSDGIEGIKGIGIVKAMRAIDKYGTVDMIPFNDPLYQYREYYLQNKQIATLKKDCVLSPVPNSDFKTDKTIENLLDKYELRKIKENLNLYKIICGVACQ
jgi:DNA polymerase-1